MIHTQLTAQKNMKAAATPWLQELRNQNLKSFEELGIPTPKNEAWKYTSPKTFVEIPFSLGEFSPEEKSSLDALPCTGFGSQSGLQLSFINGHFAPTLSSLDALPHGVEVCSLQVALQKSPELVKKFLDQISPKKREPFAALNGAFLNDGAWIHLAKGTVVENPIQINYYSIANGRPSACHPRTLVVAESGAQATLMESYAGKRDENPYLVNAVTEVFAGQGANLKHYRLQDECEQSFHLGSLSVCQERDSVFDSTQVSIGGKLSRQDVGAQLMAEGAHCTLNGLYMGHYNQHLDHQTKIDHAKPHCTSQELYKGILDDQARGVFNGQILVRPDAQKTFSSLTNQNLLLSKQAHVDTKPLLEIFADDVKCSHGATIGRLDENQIFYMRSRGLDESLSRHLLTYGFASEVLHHIEHRALRAHLEEILLNRLQIHELSVEGDQA